MKKLIYASFILVTLVVLAIASCSKETSRTPSISKSSPTPEKQTANSFEKSVVTSDADLISAINGLKSDYLDLFDLEDLLLDNAQLSDAVIHTLIAETRVPDYIVETALVTSAPVSTSELNFLQTRRPGISTTAILAAASVNRLAGFFIVNTSPRQVVFGTGFIRNSSCNCGDGTIEISNNHLLLNLTEPLPSPSGLKPCHSGNSRWYCGTSKKVTLTGTDGTTATYLTVCSQSTERCIRKPRDARFEHY